MPLNGETFTRLYSWVAESSLGVKIRADLMDADTNDIAGGISAVAAAAAIALATGQAAVPSTSLAASSGSTLMGTAQTGSGAVARKQQQKNNDNICIDDFGADPTGVADSTAAFLLARARWAAGITPCRIYGTVGGKYKISALVLSATAGSNFSYGENGITFDMHGCTFVTSSGSTSMLTIGARATPAVTWTNGVHWRGGTFDATGMANTAGTYAVSITNAYNGSVKEIVVINTPANVVDFAVLDRTYTLSIQDVFCNKASFLGFNVATDAITSLGIINLNCNVLKVDKCWNMNFFNLVVQSNAGSKVILSNCFNIHLKGGFDIEGAAGTAFDFSGGGISGFYDEGGNISSTLAYCTGVASRSVFGSRNRFVNGYVDGKPLQSLSTTSATAIFTFAGDLLASGKPAGIYDVLVTGDDGNRGFIDKVCVAFGLAVTVSQTVGYGGGQPTRAYSISGNQLMVALSSVTANNIVVALYGNPT